jgi:hypothetical protein
MGDRLINADTSFRSPAVWLRYYFPHMTAGAKQSYPTIHVARQKKQKNSEQNFFYFVIEKV